MLVKLNHGFEVDITNHVKKSKKDKSRYDLYAHFTIKENGYIHKNTVFSLGSSIPVDGWGGAKIGMKGISKNVKQINDELTEFKMKAKELLNEIKIKDELKTPSAIVHAIHTTVRTGLTGKAIRGTKRQQQLAPTNKTFPGVTELLKNDIRRNDKPLGQSRRNLYSSVLKVINKFWSKDNKETPLITHVTKQDMKAFKKWYLLTYDHTSQTRNTYLGVVTSIFNYAVEELEVIPYSPISKGFMSVVKDKDKKERHIIEETDRLSLFSLEENKLTDKELLAKYVMILQITTGMAYCDIKSLTRLHYRYDKKNKVWYIKKYRMKSGEPFNVILTAKAKQAMEKLTELAKGGYSSESEP
jgi:hypothetical protein